MNIHGLVNESITISCPGYNGAGHSDVRSYQWFKYDYQAGSRLSGQDRVASYDRTELSLGENRTENDLKDRAWLDVDSGRLTIISLQLSDEHWYTCYFSNVGKVFLSVYG